MRVLVHNAFPLRFDLRNRLVALRAAGYFFMIAVPGELYGQDSFQKVSKNQEEDSVEKVPQVTT